MTRVLSSATKAALGWICKHLMHFGVCNSLRPLYSSVLCFLKTCVSPIIVFLTLFCYIPFFPVVFRVGSNCLLFTVIWPSTDPGYDSCPAAQLLEPGPALKRRAIWALSGQEGENRQQGQFNQSAKFHLSGKQSEARTRRQTLTGVGVGRGWSLQMRGGVRRWVKAARGRGGWR